MTFPSRSIELAESPEEYDLNAYGKYDYAESRQVHYVPPPPYRDDHQHGARKENVGGPAIEIDKPQKVVIRVENFIPISDDTVQVCVSVYCAHCSCTKC